MESHIESNQHRLIQVSILIPNFNCGDFLYRSIVSVSKGLTHPFEIIVYDDASTDKSIDILMELQSTIPYLQVIKGKTNVGAGVARNILLENAKGTHVAFLDSDDWWYPDKLQKQVDVIMAENADIVTSGYDLFSIDGEKIGARKPIFNINRLSLKCTNWLPMSMTIVNLSLIGAREFPLIRHRNDYAYWLNLFDQNPSLKCRTIKDSLGGYTRRKNSLSSSQIKNLVYNFQLFHQYRKHSRLLSFTLVVINLAIRLFRK